MNNTYEYVKQELRKVKTEHKELSPANAALHTFRRAKEKSGLKHGQAVAIRGVFAKFRPRNQRRPLWSR